MDMLSLEIQAEIVRDLDPVTPREFLKSSWTCPIITLVNLLQHSDDTYDILNELPIKVREKLLLVDLIYAYRLSICFATKKM